MATRQWSLAALVVSALSLGPSFAHVLESYPRLFVWSAELWREATVFNAQYMLFAIVGAPLDVGAIVASGLLAYVARPDRRASRWAGLGALFAAAGLLAWFAVVARANAVLATWQPGPIPAEFDEIRRQWDFGHMAVAALKLLSFTCLALSCIGPHREPEPR